METRSTARFVPVGFRKVKLVLDTIRGQGAERALQVLRLNRSRAARLVEKVVHAALAAAAEQHDADAEDLVIRRAWVDVGPQRKWRLPRARGSWTPIIHRTSHIHIIVSDEAGETAAAPAAPAT
jgi:large subunit ribosomal protein L22